MEGSIVKEPQSAEPSEAEAVTMLSKASSVPESLKSKKSHASSNAVSKSLSQTSATLAAKTAALLVEAAAIAEKEQLEEEMLRLRQKAKRLDMKTDTEKLEAQQEVLEEASGCLSSLSSNSERAKEQRVAELVDKTYSQH